MLIAPMDSVTTIQTAGRARADHCGSRRRQAARRWGRSGVRRRQRAVTRRYRKPKTKEGPMRRASPDGHPHGRSHGCSPSAWQRRRVAHRQRPRSRRPSCRVTSLNGLAVDADGRLFAADCGGARVFRFDADGPVVVAGNGSQSYSGDGGPAIEAGLFCPFGPAFDERACSSSTMATTGSASWTRPADLDVRRVRPDRHRHRRARG